MFPHLEENHMKQNNNTRYSDSEYVKNALAIFHATLYAHINSPDISKRSLLFIYLYGFRSITRRQICTLLSYDAFSDATAAQLKITLAKLKSAGLIKITSTTYTLIDDQVFTLTRKGIETGRTYFLKELNGLLDRSDAYYSDYILSLLYGYRENIEEFTDILEKYADERYRDKRRSSIHRLATMDCFIASLLYFSPATVAGHSTEVKFYQGEVCEDGTLLSQSSDVRSDAMLQLSLQNNYRFDAAAATQLVCIEQDTAHQSAAILEDKIFRYANLIALPLRRKGAPPPTLVFSVLPANRAAKKRTRTGVLANDAPMVEELTRLGFLYGKFIHKDTERIALYELVDGLRDISDNSPLFDKHCSYLESHLKEYGRTLPVSALQTRYKELLAGNEVLEHHRAQINNSFLGRKRTVFTAASRVQGIELVARTGFSVCATNNYDPSTLLSLFPEQGRGRELLLTICPDMGKRGYQVEYHPFFAYRCSNGTEIVFRNAYRIGETLYIMENLSEDFCARLRLEALLSCNTAADICYLAVTPAYNTLDTASYLSSLTIGSAVSSVHICAYEPDTAAGIHYLTAHNYC